MEDAFVFMWVAIWVNIPLWIKSENLYEIHDPISNFIFASRHPVEIPITTARSDRDSLSVTSLKNLD